MAYIEFTANPKRRTNDCIIRSIANATQTDWQEVMREMCDIAIEKYAMPNNDVVAREYFNRRNIEQMYMYPGDNMTVARFCEENPEGNFVLCVPDHALSVINGDYYDLVDSANEPISAYWQVK